MRRNDARPIDALIDQYRSIDERLFLEGRVIARVEIGDGSARDGDIARNSHRDTNARDLASDRGGVVGGGKRGKGAHLVILECRRKQSEMIPSAQLVVGDAGRVGEGSIQLPRFHAKHTAGVCRVAG